MEKLKEIEIVDKLSGDASGRTVREKIFLSRQNGLDVLENKSYQKSNMFSNIDVKKLISIIYHELWHVNTWDKYEDMYEYVLDENNDICTIYAFVYWIEYISHIETVHMEVPEIMLEFCNKFSHEKWYEIEYAYSYFIKKLPYFLARAKYLDKLDDFIEQIRYNELKEAVIKFNVVSDELYKNKDSKEIEKAMTIRKMIDELFS